MILTGMAALLLLGFGGDEDARSKTMQSGSLTVRQQIIVRIPRVGPQRGVAARPIQWREGRGQRCIAVRNVAGAGLLGPSTVDLILRDASRVRIRLHRRCPALDFYRGFYVTSSGDGRICADRDAIRARSGGECEIEQFRALYPVDQ